jgi:hypothetical protein
VQKKQDEELLNYFHLMDAEEREFQVLNFKTYTEGRQEKRATLLRIVGGTASGPECRRIFG